METTILIALGVFFSSSALLLFLYLKTLNESKKTISNLKNDIDNSNIKFKNLKTNLDILKNELSTKRIGYYDTSINLLSAEDRAKGKKSDQYDLQVHVKELDRYTNGLSKIEIIKLDLISGYDQSQYDWVKQVLREKFASIKKTADITWLESEENIKEMRKQKLENIKTLIKNNE